MGVPTIQQAADVSYILITLNELCTPASGVSGFVLQGTDAYVLSWFIVGDQLVLVTDQAILSTDTPVLTYSSASGQIINGSNLPLQDFFAYDVYNLFGGGFVATVQVFTAVAG